MILGVDFVALAPVLLHINPILGSLIGVVATLIIVAVAIIIIVRLRRGGDDDKEFQTGTLATTPNERRDELLDKGSLESLEDKNPDIVPSLNVYVGGGVYTMKVKVQLNPYNAFLNQFFCKGDDIAYAQLYPNQQTIPMTTIRRQELSVYSQKQPLDPSFQTLHHPFIPGPVRSEPSVEFELPLISSTDETQVSVL